MAAVGVVGISCCPPQAPAARVAKHSGLRGPAAVVGLKLVNCFLNFFCPPRKLKGCGVPANAVRVWEAARS